jgi:hypothetical protein
MQMQLLKPSLLEKFSSFQNWGDAFQICGLNKKKYSGAHSWDDMKKGFAPI